MIYHVLEKADWESRRHETHVAVPGPDHFVHCCDERQLASVRETYFAKDAIVVALVVDPTRLEVETRYEAGSGGEAERFPHVYGPIERSAVREVLNI
jgi:uncharacterized protein (DUF952 family)